MVTGRSGVVLDGVQLLYDFSLLSVGDRTGHCHFGERVIVFPVSGYMLTLLFCFVFGECVIMCYRFPIRKLPSRINVYLHISSILTDKKSV